MPKIQVKCPSCSQIGDVDVSEDNIKTSTRGILAISVNNICSHSFIIYIDRNFHIRDYFIVDFSITLPKIDIPRKEDILFPLKDTIDLELVKLNLSGRTLSYIINCIFLNKKIALILEEEFLRKHFQNFLDYITKDSFDCILVLIDEEQYQKNRENLHKHYKDYVFLGNENLKSLKKIKVEKQIVQNFINEQDENFSLLLLKNEIKKVYELSRQIIKINSRLTKNQILTSRRILDYFEKQNIIIDVNYLNFLIEVVKANFGVEINLEHPRNYFDF
ncbi:MAG: hypothetical protein ACFFAH_06315 [Promethearchaeota archaeon]